MEWAIYYSDHSEDNDTSVSSEQATPFSIERRSDIQVIIQKDSEHNWVTLSGCDYYMWDERGGGAKWFGGDREGLSSYLRKSGYKCVLIGDMIDKYLFREIFIEAKKSLGEKSGYDNIERHP
ncbi:MAG: hypothetical protein ACXABD_21835 [Candidatus Thorarchaeota archaeon]